MFCDVGVLRAAESPLGAEGSDALRVVGETAVDKACSVGVSLRWDCCMNMLMLDLCTCDYFVRYFSLCVQSVGPSCGLRLSTGANKTLSTAAFRL